MEKIAEIQSKLNSMSVDHQVEEEVKINIFEELKQYNIQLLLLLQNPKYQFPNKLLHLLRKSHSSALKPFFDYTLFPLLILLDAAVNSRSRKVSSEGPFFSETPEPMMEVSDAVAEGIICCLEELLKKCPLGSVNQMIVILKKLTSGALLSPVDASEEFREGVIRCFKALLLNLHVCSDKSCLCKQVRGSSTQHDVAKGSHGSREGECLLAFLQSESASPAIGHWLSLLLKAADDEAARGHRGSAALRVEAFKTLRVLIAKVGSADALAFFLPGVVSQIGKVLQVSKSMISGASGSTEALDQAIRGLAEIIGAVLNDYVNVTSLHVLDETAYIGHKTVDHTASVLDKLRHLSNKGLVQSENTKGTESNDRNNFVSALIEKENTNSDHFKKSLRVDRTKDWIATTSANVDKLLSATFPHLCLNPSKKVRKGLLAAIKALLTLCRDTLKQSRSMFLECLCILVCDDAGDVSSAAQVVLQFLLSSKDQCIIHDVAEVISRLIKKLPKILLGGDESIRLSHLQKLLVLIYFSGPRLVCDQLQSPVAAAQFLDLLALCFSHNSLFAGSLEKIVVARDSSRYIPSIAEMNSCSHTKSMGPNFSVVQEKMLVQASDTARYESEFPRMPPWFIHVGSEKLYQVLAGIIRLVGISVFAEGSLSLIIDIPLGYLRNLVLELRSRAYSKENWQSWYSRTDTEKLVRQASTAACILNEMIHSLSNEAITTFDRIVQKTGNYERCETEPDESIWKISQRRGARSHLVECIGNILHEYLSTEIWGLPVEIATPIQSSHEDGEISLHFFHDNAMLHQVITEGIGVFNICLGQEFSSCGFLHSSLMKLLENLICANFQVKSASDAVLHVISTTHGYPSVGHLVLANSDSIIDAICRQLRHLDLNPHIPNVLAALLSQIGVADKILPLLDEPMRAVSMELEILGRHQHPELTIPFLKALAEIAKASKHEALVLPNQAELFLKNVEIKVSDILREKQPEAEKSQCTCNYNQMMSMEPRKENDYDLMQMEFWETIIFKLNDSKRYRMTIGSLGGSCLAAATPLLASANPATCLIALDIIEDGILMVSKVEEAHKHEKNAKGAIEPLLELLSFYNLMDTLNAAEDETVENRLLPAINKVWPFLISCVRQNNPVAVRKCSRVISNAVQICGGDFFSRRFQNDGIHFWRLLSTSPFQKKSISKAHSLLLPYRKNKASSENSFSEITNLKVQVAILDMISELARNKRSASALKVVLKKISGIVVGIACSGVKGLQEASIQALKGLSSIDADLIWLLVADVYYSLTRKDKPAPPSTEFPHLSQILPSPSSSKGYLYVLYGGQSYGLDIDFSAVEKVFNTLHT
ncbi:hypothetical protein LIER_17099 [Lithospermum erythrorhizon]|uniref:ARM repeat superfamily protein n=1 Tax=Lithospermum erythrorhizon TaxID=34254 RepID=A0AAV3QDF8_LITER